MTTGFLPRDFESQTPRSYRGPCVVKILRPYRGSNLDKMKKKAKKMPSFDSPWFSLSYGVFAIVVHFFFVALLWLVGSPRFYDQRD